MRSLSLALLIAFGCASNMVFAQGDDLNAKVHPKDKTRYIVETPQVNFATPKNWNLNRSGKPTIAILTPKGETYPQVTQMISIDVGKAALPDAKATAESLAKEYKGKVLPEALKLDGEVAYRMQAEPVKGKSQPLDCVIAFKNGRAYILMGGGTKSEGLAKAIDQLIAEWKWK